MAIVEPEEVEGLFASRKKRAVRPMFGGAVLKFGDWYLLGWFILKRTGPSMPVKSNQ